MIEAFAAKMQRRYGQVAMRRYCCKQGVFLCVVLAVGAKIKVQVKLDMEMLLEI